MRLVPVNCVTEGNILAKTIYDINGRVLLTDGCKLTNSILKRITANGIYSLYINDKYSTNEIEDLIKPELRLKALKTLKDGMEGGISKQKTQSKLATKIKYDYIDNISKLANDIIDEIIYQKNVMINLADIKSVDNYTYEHCLNVAVLSIVIGIELRLSRKTMIDLAIGALLHDIGKMFVPKEILLKNSALTKEEFELIKVHPVEGYKYVKENYNISIPSKNIILYHHEKYDGSGYPDGLKQDKIYELAKIVTIADVYDALTSDRPYRRALSPNEALEYIMGASNRHFDINFVNAFIKRVVPYPVGTLVKLTNGDVGVVLETNPEVPLRPRIKVIRPNKLIDLDLMEIKDVVINGVQYTTPKL